MANQASMNFGQVRYVSAVEAKPARQTVEGNVTTNYAAVPGSPQYFDVHFFLSCPEERNGITITNHFGWDVAVVGLAPETPYNEIEDAAAHKLVQSLRAAAQAIENLVARSDGGTTDGSKSDDTTK